MSVKLKTPSNGSVTLAPEDTASDVVVSLPASTGVIASTTATQTFTNKTLTNPTINGFTGDTSVINIGSGQIYKDASGNVGVGTAAPAVSGLEISRATGSASPTPVELRLSSTTNAADFSTTDPWGRLSFWSGDTSNGGAKINASIDAVAFNAVGGLSNLVFSVARTTSGILSKSIEIEGSAQNTIFYTSGSERMRIDSAGNVGIGTSSPVQRLSVSGTASSLVSLISSTTEANIRFDNSTASNAFFGTTGGANFFWFSGGTERARIDSSGNLLVGTTSTGPGDGNTNTGNSITASGQAFHSGSGGRVLILNRNTSNGIIQVFHREGLLVGNISVTTTATTYNTSSDQRLKENITDAPPASESIDAIQIRSFDWKADGSHQKYGVIAQELEAIAPEAVSKGEKEDDMWGVDYSKLVPMMVKAIQELKAEVDQLKAQLGDAE